MAQSDSSYDLSMFENPDLDNFTPGPYLYFYDKISRRGRTYPFDPTAIHFMPVETRGVSNIVRLQARNPLTGCLEPLCIQTPSMPSIFGLTAGMKSDSDKNATGSSSTNAGGWKIDLSFKEMLQLRYNRDNVSNQVQEIEQFFMSLYILDQVTLKKAKENVGTWFPGSRKLVQNPDLIDGLYQTMTAPRYSTNKKRYYAPALRVKAAKSRGEFNFRVFDTECRPLRAEDIQPDCRVTAVLEVTGIWFVADKFGVGLRLLQAQVEKNETMDSFCIAKPDDDDDAAENVAVRSSSRK